MGKHPTTNTNSYTTTFRTRKNTIGGVSSKHNSSNFNATSLGLTNVDKQNSNYRDYSKMAYDINKTPKLKSPTNFKDYKDLSNGNKSPTNKAGPAITGFNQGGSANKMKLGESFQFRYKSQMRDG